MGCLPSPALTGAQHAGLQLGGVHCLASFWIDVVDGNLVEDRAGRKLALVGSAEADDGCQGVVCRHEARYMEEGQRREASA